MTAHTESEEEAIFRSLLKGARLSAGVKQAALAAALAKPQSFVSKFESGERTLTVAEARRVCRALGYPFLGLVAEFERHLEAP